MMQRSIGRAGLSLADRLRSLDRDDRLGIVSRLPEDIKQRLNEDWETIARPEQLPPVQSDWWLWLVMAGRGFGKTRAGAEWVDARARADGRLRIALVGASFDDVRHVMIEGESGILRCAPGLPRPVWAPALRRVVWPGGAMARCYSAAEPEGLRGPAHHMAWADEVARWDASAAGMSAGGDGARARSRGEMAWDNLLLGLRLGERPQLCATTTPRAVPLVRRIYAMPDAVISGGSTLANRDNLSGSFIATMQDQYGETSWGRQEIGGELIEDVAGALWSRAMIEECRIERFPTLSEPDGGLNFSRIVIGVDPPASSGGDACGIVVCASLAAPFPSVRGPGGLSDDRGDDGAGFRYVVLEDATVEKASPARWARGVAEAAMRWGADRIVAEANNGGEMVARVIEAEAADLPVVLVHARGAKAARAEPVSIAYVRGRVAHAGVFARLEDEMCGLISGGGYAGPGRSPDRADALVWALSELMTAERRGGPRVRGL